MLFAVTFIAIIEILSDQVKCQCPDGYLKPSVPFTSDGTVCYKIVCNGQMGERWVDADRKCKESNGRLAILENFEEAKWILEVSLSKYTACDKYYLNAHASLYNQEVAWFGGDLVETGNGHAISSINRSNPEQSCLSSGEELNFAKECFYINKDRIISDIDCSHQAASIGFICKTWATISPNDKAFKNTLSELEIGEWNKPNISLRSTDSLYYFVSGKQKISSWYAQQNFCWNLGGELAIIENLQELEWIEKQARKYEHPNKNFNSWGVNFHESWFSNEIGWKNGMLVSFGTWLPGENCKAFRNCGFYRAGNESGWLLLWCSCIGCHHGFICQKALSLHSGPVSQSYTSTSTPVSTATQFITASPNWNNSSIYTTPMTKRTPFEKNIEVRIYWIAGIFGIFFSFGILIWIVISLLFAKRKSIIEWIRKRRRIEPPPQEVILHEITHGSNPSLESTPIHNSSNRSISETNLDNLDLTPNGTEIPELARPSTGGHSISQPPWMPSRGGSRLSVDPDQLHDQDFGNAFGFSVLY